MKSFQLDQCFGSKRFVRQCDSEGLCQVLRLPAELRDAEDPQLLAFLGTSHHPLLTFDRTLAHDHTSAIPHCHPGILIVSNYPEPQTMTIRIAQRILGHFKLSFDRWHDIHWSNSIVELSTIGIEVWHVAGAELIRDAYLSFDSSDWMDKLAQAIELNAGRESR